MPISSFDPSGPAMFLQIGGVALAGALIGFALALVDRWSVKRSERAEDEMRHGPRRRRSSQRQAGDWAKAKLRTGN